MDSFATQQERALDSLRAALKYSNESTTALADGYFFVEPRFSPERPMGHIYALHLLQALDGLLVRPGIDPVALEWFRVRREVTTRLMAHVTTEKPAPHREKPIVEVGVRYADGQQRWVSAWGTESPTIQKSAPTPFTFMGVLGPSDKSLTARFVDEIGWRHRPGLIAGNCLHASAGALHRWLSGDRRTPLDRCRVLIHSAQFELPKVEDLFDGGGRIELKSTSIVAPRTLSDDRGLVAPIEFSSAKPDGSGRCAGKITFAYVR